MHRRKDGRGRLSDGLLMALFLLAGAAMLERFDRPDGGVVLDDMPVNRADTVAPAAAQPRAPAGPAVDLGRAAVLLDTIAVEPEHRRGYDRDAWPHWLDRDGDCLNTREAVLVAESLEAVRRSVDGCGVVSGRWRDPYTGEVFTNPGDLDIDHRVALQEAHDSGGHAWDRARRAAYANDLDDPDTLVAVSAAANRAKGAKGPEEWLPPDSSALCRYVAGWIAVKARWDLSMDERERITVANILANCRAQVAEGGPR